MSARPVDEELERARREWWRRFRENARRHRELFERWPEDNTPTPRTEEDSE